MAGNAVIGALRVVLGADTALFESGLKNAKKDLDAFHRSVTQVGALIGASIGAAAVALGVSLQRAFNQADEMGKMAQRIGIPVEQLSGLRLAADLSGVSMENLGVAVGRLSRSMSEIAGGATNTASRAFVALGISVKNADGTLKTSSQVMEEVADRFRSMQDGAGKTALAIAIFGRSGAAMIPMLNQGAAGLREAREEAEALGLIISRQTAAAAEAFNDNMRRLGLVTQGVALQLAADLAPALAVLTGRMVDAAKEGNVVRAAADGIRGAFFAVSEDVAKAVIVFRNVGAELNALGGIMVAVAQRGRGLGAAWEEWKRVQADIAAQTGTVTESLRALREEVANYVTSVGKLGRSAAAPIIATESAFDKFIKTQQKAIAGERAEAATIGQVAGARESLRIIMQGQAIAAENNITLTARQREQLAALAGEARNAALQQAGFQLVMENKTPLEQYQQALANTEIAMRSVGATAEQIASAQEKAAERFGMSWSAIGTNIAGTAGALSQLTGTFAKENKAMGIASKAFGIAQAIINTQVAITKALATLPPPASYAAVALAVATGAASIAAISAQKFATGGAMRMKLPPGGGVDSQLLTARVRPDEQVDIWRPGEGPDQRRGGGRGVTVVQMQLPSGAAGRFIEELISDINGKIADGYRLKVA